MAFQLSIMLFSAPLFHGLPAAADIIDCAGIPDGEICAGEHPVGVAVNYYVALPYRRNAGYLGV